MSEVKGVAASLSMTQTLQRYHNREDVDQSRHLASLYHSIRLRSFHSLSFGFASFASFRSFRVGH